MKFVTIVSQATVLPSYNSKATVSLQIVRQVTLLSSVKDVWSGSRVTWNRAKLLRSGRELTTKVGEQPWPQLVRCASICCHVCGCVFQED